MQIILEDKDIQEAIKNHLGNLGVNTDGKSVDVDIKPGRGANGDSAVITVTDVSADKAAKQCDGAFDNAEPAEDFNDQTELFPEPPAV